MPDRADGTRGKGKGVVNDVTDVSALSSTQDNTVRVADVLQCLTVLGTVQPVGWKGTVQDWTAGLPPDMKELRTQDTCTPAERPQNMTITPHESIDRHRFSYNRLRASRGGGCRTRLIQQTPPPTQLARSWCLARAIT